MAIHAASCKRIRTFLTHAYTHAREETERDNICIRHGIHIIILDMYITIILLFRNENMF